MFGYDRESRTNSQWELMQIQESQPIITNLGLVWLLPPVSLVHPVGNSGGKAASLV